MQNIDNIIKTLDELFKQKKFIQVIAYCNKNSLKADIKSEEVEKIIQCYSTLGLSYFGIEDFKEAQNVFQELEAIIKEKEGLLEENIEKIEDSIKKVKKEKQELILTKLSGTKLSNIEISDIVDWS